MQTDLTIRQLFTRDPFRIARPRLTPIKNVFVRITSDGIIGYGEASPSTFYGETAQGVAGKIRDAMGFLSTLRISSRKDIEQAWHGLWAIVSPSRAAQCALDLALWDWLAKSRQLSVSALLWGETPHPIPTFCTIGLSTAEELSRKIPEMEGFPAIKIKSDQAVRLETVCRVRSTTNASLAVDANCSWLEVDLPAVSAELRAFNLEFIEQPFPPDRNALIPRLKLGPPIFADESCASEEDVARIAPFFGGCNIKLVKCGGLTPALRMREEAKRLGLKTMVGCMLESSLLIGAGATLAQRTDYADLDGAWLLREDPFSGWKFERGVLHPPQGVGLGAEPATPD